MINTFENNKMIRGRYSLLLFDLSRQDFMYTKIAS